MPIMAGPVPTTETGLRDHLHLLHGTYTVDEHDPAGLVECHRQQHQDLDPLYFIGHTHSPRRSK